MRKARRRDMIMAVSRVSRKTTKKIGTEKRSTAILLVLVEPECWDVR